MPHGHKSANGSWGMLFWASHSPFPTSFLCGASKWLLLLLGRRLAQLLLTSGEEDGTGDTWHQRCFVGAAAPYRGGQPEARSMNKILIRGQNTFGFHSWWAFLASSDIARFTVKNIVKHFRTTSNMKNWLIWECICTLTALMANNYVSCHIFDFRKAN